MKYLVALGFGCIVVLLCLLTVASENTAHFMGYYSWLVVVNVAVILFLLGVLFFWCRSLWRSYQLGVFGARLTVRLLSLVSLLAILPGVIVYVVSLQFVSNSIDRWFNADVEHALEDGLSVAQDAVQHLLEQLQAEALTVTTQLSFLTAPELDDVLAHLLDTTDILSAAVLSPSGQLLSSETKSTDLVLVPKALPSVDEIQWALQNNGHHIVASTHDNTIGLSVLLPFSATSLAYDRNVLFLHQVIPESLTATLNNIGEVYNNYRSIAQTRFGLKNVYALGLTLTLLLSLLLAVTVAFYFSRGVSAALYRLTEGTQAVAQGDFSPRLALDGLDELALLMQSFNHMTDQLKEARAESQKHQRQVEKARAYLASILDNISAGVMAFDARFILKMTNNSARRILKDDFEGLEKIELPQWPRLLELSKAVMSGFFGEQEALSWQQQISYPVSGAENCELLLRGSSLCDTVASGYVIVFDDVTRLVRAQRMAAWAEVAQRLAHEIKNPLTPIQLSADRLLLKLEAKLSEDDSQLLRRSVHTIVNQVSAMRTMLDEFRDFACLPLVRVERTDLIAFVREVLILYEQGEVIIQTAFTQDSFIVDIDPGQCRQVLHNLLRNAQEALKSIENPVVVLSIEQNNQMVWLKVSDNGPGFDPVLISKVCSPYVTTKLSGGGLGLAIVKKIVDEHHGVLHIRNQKVGGALVEIGFPVAA